jgi:hypothetical protein
LKLEIITDLLLIPECIGHKVLRLRRKIVFVFSFYRPFAPEQGQFKLQNSNKAIRQFRKNSINLAIPVWTKLYRRRFFVTKRTVAQKI